MWNGRVFKSTFISVMTEAYSLIVACLTVLAIQKWPFKRLTSGHLPSLELSRSIFDNDIASLVFR